METTPFDVRHELAGWTLFWARLTGAPNRPEQLARLRESVTLACRERLTVETLSAQPTVAALRRLFRAAGCDPTRYRPSSEALLRRLLKGSEMPAIHPLVDLNNCLSAELAVPCCVMAEESFSPPLVLRSGLEGESYESLRGPFNLSGKPLLADERGPLDAPITGSRRAKVRAGTHRVWLVAYLPAETLTAEAARDKLAALLAAAPVAELEAVAASGASDGPTEGGSR